jgi:hypothetical protein
MPWKTESVMEQRLSFVIEARKHEGSLSELSRRYGISPTDRLQVAEALPGSWNHRRAEGEVAAAAP